jgi:hypothetical protein
MSTDDLLRAYVIAGGTLDEDAAGCAPLIVCPLLRSTSREPYQIQALSARLIPEVPVWQPIN